MDFLHTLLFTAFLILAAPIDEAHAYATVTGSVFCDQCKDGQRSFFDYPLSGIFRNQPNYIFFLQTFVPLICFLIMFNVMSNDS